MHRMSACFACVRYMKLHSIDGTQILAVPHRRWSSTRDAYAAGHLVNICARRVELICSMGIGVALVRIGRQHVIARLMAANI
jgi:hypothetical protein